MPYFNPRDTRCRRPFGAAVSGCPIEFAALCDEGVEGELWLGRDGEEQRAFRLAADGASCRYTADGLETGLWFYHVVVSGERFPAAGEFQLTVYDRGYRAPEGWAGGTMYQIFPDRFFVGGDVLRGGCGDRVFHESPLDEPCYLPDESGEVRNRDYFGGNLRGITEKLPYLKELSVSCIYLNPIFEAHSNHRYNTADYMKIDPTLGTEEDFVRLCGEAHRLGIRIIIDGVFSHTGDDSVYFNRYGRYDTLGAYQSVDSKYYKWYKFKEFPDSYVSWWGFKTLPEVNEMEESYRRFICGEGGVIEHWLTLGADGIRLDVADELPDDFIRMIRAAVKRCGEDKLLVGEVWEDASSKISYGARRRFLWGDELDSVMNYPFREAVLTYMWDGCAERFTRAVAGICENYPAPMLDLMMNSLSTHDTERAVTRLALGPVKHLPKDEQQRLFLSRDEYLRGVELMKMATALQFTLPGIPCVYYGDEIGMQGGGDPFCRRFMRWDDADDNLRGFVKKIAKERSGIKAFAHGSFVPIFSDSPMCVCFVRDAGDDGRVLVAVNRGDDAARVGFEGRERELAPWSYLIEEL